MKRYIVTVVLDTESGGINGCYPTPSRVAGYIRDVLYKASGRSEKHKVKVKTVGVISAVPLTF